MSWMGREGKYGVEGQVEEGPECCEVVRADLGETWEVIDGIPMGSGDEQTEEASKHRRGKLG